MIGDFNHGHQILLLTQDCLLAQHVLEPTRSANMLDLILASQNEFVLLRKQGKRSKKKHLSKEAIEKIAHK